MTDRVLGELVALRQQLRIVASSPGVHAARKLTADVLPVLEPVWSLLVEENNGVGFLRGFEPHNHNTTVATEAVRAYQSIDLTGPDLRDVWQAVSRPSIALVESIRTPPRPRHVRRTGPVPATLGATVRPALPGVLLADWQDEAAVVPALRRILRMWCDLARNTTGERREVARLTLAAAMLARGAVLDGDTETVKWFVKRWLGMVASDTRVDGTSAALLENSWLRRTVDDEFSAVRDSVTDLRIESMYQHRVHRPVWETQLRGDPVALLDEAASTLPASDDSPEDAAAKIFLREELARVLDALSPLERRCLQLRIVDDLPPATVAEMLGLSVHESRRLRDRAMAKVRHPNWSTLLRDYI